MKSFIRKQIIFSDESKFNTFKFYDYYKIWRKMNREMNPKNLYSILKHEKESLIVILCKDI